MFRTMNGRDFLIRTETPLAGVSGLALCRV